MSFPLYSLGIAYTNDWLASEQVLGASAALVVANGVGAVLGPLVAAGLTLAFGISQYFVTLALVHGAVVVFIGYRMATRDALPVDEQEHYVPFPARASAVAANLFVRRRPVRPTPGLTDAGSTGSRSGSASGSASTSG